MRWSKWHLEFMKVVRGFVTIRLFLQHTQDQEEVYIEDAMRRATAAPLKICTAAGAVDWEFLLLFCYVYSGFEVREVLQRLPGGRGFVLTEYEPVGSHGDPVHDDFYRFRTLTVGSNR